MINKVYMSDSMVISNFSLLGVSYMYVKIYHVFFRLSQTCNHVAALLFKIEAAYRLDLSNPAKTSLANEWLSPSAAKGPLNMKLQEMDFVKPSFSKGDHIKNVWIFYFTLNAYCTCKILLGVLQIILARAI